MVRNNLLLALALSGICQGDHGCSGSCCGSDVWHKSEAEWETEASEKQTLCFDVGSIMVQCGSAEGGCSSSRWVFNLFKS